MPPAVAFVRSVPASFADALTSAGSRPVIDVARAKHQHAGYVDRLRGSGYQVEILPTPDEFPDGPFIEDAGVLLGDVLLLARPAVSSRQGEIVGVGSALRDRYEIRSIEPPGTLEGGDVLRMGDRLYVGLSTRTNREGREQLAVVASEHGLETVTVPVSNALHLKTVVTALDADTLVAAAGHFDPEAFAGYRILWADGDREVNTLALPDGRVLVPESKRAVQEVVSEAGFRVTGIDVSEFEKADGGLTCLSLRTDAS